MFYVNYVLLNGQKTTAYTLVFDKSLACISAEPTSGSVNSTQSSVRSPSTTSTTPPSGLILFTLGLILLWA